MHAPTGLYPETDFYSDPDTWIPHVLTDGGALLAELDAMVQSPPPAPPVTAPVTEAKALLRPSRPALVLLLGTGPSARAVLETGAMPIELRADDANSDTWVAGLAHLAERVDALLASRDWNGTAAGRRAVVAAGLIGTPVFFDLGDFRAWFERWRVALAGAAKWHARRADADELPGRP